MTSSALLRRAAAEKFEQGGGQRPRLLARPHADTAGAPLRTSANHQAVAPASGGPPRPAYGVGSGALSRG
jgi:hypothetical protein